MVELGRVYSDLSNSLLSKFLVGNMGEGIPGWVNLFICVLFIRGLTPADAEYNFLMKAKDLDYYGIELFQAQVLKYRYGSCDIM